MNAETTQFAYGVNAGDWTLTQYRVNPETGVLRHNGHQAVIKFPAAVGVDPSKQFVLAVLKTTEKIAVFRINQKNGRLKEIPESPFRAGAISPYSISFHPSGRFVYVSAREGKVLGFAIDKKTGVLTPTPGSPYDAQLRTRSVKVHPSGRFVYASNAYANSISAYVVDQQTGALSPVAGSPFDTGEVSSYTEEELKQIDTPLAAGGIPYRVAIHPSGRFVYVTNRAGPSVSVFKIDTGTGVLTPLQDSPVKLEAEPYGVTVHPSGRFVYVTGWQVRSIWGFAVDENSGKLTPLSPPYVDSEGHAPISVTLNNAGTRAYVPNVYTNSISLFSVDSKSGLLSFVDKVRTRNRPFDIALLESAPVKRSPRFAYVEKNAQGPFRILRENADSGLHASQKLAKKESAPTPVPPAAVVDPLGHFLYMARFLGEKHKENGIAVYRIDSATGELTLLPKQGIHLGFTPTDMALDTSGGFLYAVNPTINQYGAFIVDPETGALSLTKSLLPNIGLGASAVALDPAARYSFIANAKENTVTVFSIIRTLSPAIYPYHPEKFVFATGKNPVALAVDPRGEFLVVANRDSNNLSVFRIHPNDGLLEAVKGSPFASGKAPVSVAMHPNGKFVYVANADSNNISSYRLDAGSGKLTVMPGRVDAGKQPQTIRISSNGRFVYVHNKGSDALRKYAVDKQSGLLTFSGITDVGPITAIAQ